MAEKIKWDKPSGSGLLFTPPDPNIQEAKKNADWYAQYGRWAVANFYNQPASGFTDNLPLNVGVASNAITNWSYVFGRQKNNDYKFATTDFSGSEIPAVWIPGGKIGQLVDHLKGVVLEAIENIEVTAKNLSSKATSQKAEMKEKLMIQFELKDVLKELGTEVQYNPVNDPAADLSTPEDIEKYVENWQDQYAIAAEKMGESQIFSDQLAEKFQLDATNQMVGGLSGIITELIDGYVCNTVIPSYELIWDNRNNDPFNQGAMVAGYIKHAAPYEEVIARFQNDLSEEDKKEIRQMAINGYSNEQDFLNYYNTNLGVGNQFNWWNGVGTSSMTVAYAMVYFIAPRDLRYRTTKSKTTKINDNETYTNNKGEKVKGTEISGDFSTYDLYQVGLIGNKFVVSYGLANNVLRHRNKKGRPRLPINIFCGGMALNQANALVTKLRRHQDTIDLYEYKIQAAVGKSAGKTYILNGNKAGATTSAEVMNDLKTFGVYVTEGSSGESDDPQNSQRMVESMDMTLSSDITTYIQLRAEQERMMEEITSVSRIALGQQQNTVGKGVQQNTINQNSYGTAALMWGMMKHFQRVVQYNVDLLQLFWQHSDTLNETLILGDKGAYLLNVADPKEFGTQYLMVFLQISSMLDTQQKEQIVQLAHAAAQNGEITLLDFIENVLLKPTANQTVSGLKLSMNKRAREMKENQAAQMQHEASIQTAKLQAEGATIQLKEDNANYRSELTAIVDMITKLQLSQDALAQQMATQPPLSPINQQQNNQ